MEQYLPTYDSYSAYTTERYVPTARFQVMNSVYLPASDIDFRTGRLQPDRQRRCRTQAIRLEKARLDLEESRLLEAVNRESAKGGIRISMRAMILTLAVTVFFCGIFLLTQQGIIADRQKSINRLERSITDYRSQNSSLEAQIAEASDAATICYAASRDLNMIPAEAADAIHLVAVDTRPQQTAAQEQPTLTARNVQTLTMTDKAAAPPSLSANAAE